MSAPVRHPMGGARRARPTRRSTPPLVGRDLAGGRPRRRRPRQLPALFAGLLLAGLGLAALRIDLLRVRYALTDAISEEKDLLEQHRALTAQMRTLRDPARLAVLASRRGLVRAQKVIDLRGPAADRP